MKRKLLLVFFTLLFIEANAQQEIYNFSPDNTSPQFFEKFNGKIYFEGYDTNNGRALWKSDGTSENTFFFKDTHSRNDKISTLKSGSAILNNTLYYIASDETSAGELWKTNGTIEGTIKVTNFLNGKVTTLTVVGNVIYFIIAKGDGKTSIWKTDGTELGTVLVKEISPTWNDPSFEGKCSNLFMFSIQPAGTNNTRVWRSDGTSEGTFPITEELDGNGSGMVGGSGGSSILTQFIEYNNKLYFASRHFLFETDGTVENTKNVATVRNPLLGGLVYYDDVIAVNNSLYLMFVTQKSFANTIGNISILRFDTLNNTIVSVYEKKIDKYFLASSLTRTGNSITFTTSNANGGTELVSLNLSDNVVSSIGELAGANDLEESPIALSINLVSMLKFNENQYFIRAGRDKINNRKGWIYDLDVKTLENISNLDNARLPFEFNNYLYYSKDGKLWKYSNNLSIPLIESGASLVFYPNPATDFVNIQDEYKNEVENVQIFDLNGKVVSGKTDFATDKIDVSRLNQGTYILKAKVKGTVISKKIIKN
jgi:ELWxxDGT repeat protein